jgi:3-polyprenyl-4-hydroxybenzoate decarboxylase
MLDQPAASHRRRLHDGPRLDFQDHLADLEAKGLLVRIDRAINKDTELHPLVRWQFLGGVPEDKRRAFLFTHVTDAKGRRYDIPVVVGALAASPEIYAIGMGQPVPLRRWPSAPRAARRSCSPAMTSRHRVAWRGCQCRSRRPGSTPRPI